MMELCQTLKAAIDSLDLSTDDRRHGAAALAIVLLENLLSAEIDERNRAAARRCEISGCEIEPMDCPSYERYDYYDNYNDDVWVLHTAASTLYHSYALRHYKRYGIRAHIYKNKKEMTAV